MTTQEMHIELDLELQKVNAQVSKNIQPEEKDWFLNNEVIKYLKAKVNPSANIKKLGFEDVAKRVEDVKDLIRVSSQPIKTNSRGKAYISLPSDYFNYIRFDSYGYKDCPDNPPSKATIKQYRVAFKVELTKDSLTDYTISITTSTGTVQLFSLDDLPDDYLSNTEGSKQNFILIKALKVLLPTKVKDLISPSTQLYWEIESYSYTSLSFVLVSDVELTGSIVVYNTVSTPTTATVEDIVVNSKTTKMLKSKLRVIDEEFLTDVENSHLSKSRVNSPISSVVQGCLEVSETKGAIFNSIDVVYICRPNLIDLNLNSNLNVSDNVAKEIVSNTIRFLKGIIGNQGEYQAYAQENVLTE